WRVRNRTSGRVEAVKVARAEALHGRGRPRFQTEMRAAAAARHDSVCAFYSSGESPQGLPYFSMEYVEGPTLRQWRRENPGVHCKAISPAPEDRHASAAELADDLENVANGEAPPHTRPIGWLGRTRRWLRRRRTRLAAALAAVVLVGTIVTLLARQWQHARTA